MSAIAYRDGVMAADSSVSIGELLLPSVYFPKIRRYSDSLVGCSGDDDDIARFYEWMEQGEPPDKKPSLDRQDGFTVMRVKPDGRIEWACWTLHWVPQKVPFYAIGAPWLFLFGAMAAGATAETAVRLAIQYTSSAAGDVQIEYLSAAHQFAGPPSYGGV